MNLFRILFDGVATAPSRPPLWPDQVGLCAVCLFAENKEDALQRAQIIVETLPFIFLDEHHILGHAAIVYGCDAPRRTDIDTSDGWEFLQIWKEMEENARQSGLSFAYFPVAHVQTRPPAADTRIVRFLIDPTNPEALR